MCRSGIGELILIIDRADNVKVNDVDKVNIVFLMFMCS